MHTKSYTKKFVCGAGPQSISNKKPTKNLHLICSQRRELKSFRVKRKLCLLGWDTLGCLFYFSLKKYPTHRSLLGSLQRKYLLVFFIFLKVNLNSLWTFWVSYKIHTIPMTHLFSKYNWNHFIINFWNKKKSNNSSWIFPPQMAGHFEKWNAYSNCRCFFLFFVFLKHPTSFFIFLVTFDEYCSTFFIFRFESK